MKIIIDDKVCTKHKMTLNEVLLALLYRNCNDVVKIYNNMLNRQILTNKNGNVYVTQRWSEVLDVILADSGTSQDEERLKNLAAKMRESYPEGRMIDRYTGKPTPYYFRCNPSEIQNKLKTFFNRYGNKSDEEILDAERRYVESFNGNFQQAGFRLLKYFIWKDNPKQGPDGNYVESISPLLDFLANKEDEGVKINSDDWQNRMI